MSSASKTKNHISGCRRFGQRGEEFPILNSQFPSDENWELRTGYWEFCLGPLRLLQVFIDGFTDLREDCLLLLGPVDLHDLSLRKVGRQEVGFPVIVLEVLFDLVGLLAL